MFRLIIALTISCGFARPLPTRGDEPLVPLTMLGTSTYQGKQGGLWPDGANTPPAAQVAALTKASARIVPRDAEGRPSDGGRIGFVSVGASTGKQMMDGMIAAAGGTSALNPRVTLVNGCLGGADINKLNLDQYWSKMNDSLKSAGLTAAQVQAAWLQTDDLRDQEADFPGRPERFKEGLVGLVQLVKQNFPNLQIFYLFDRHTTAFGTGEAVKGKHGEPRPYYVGWSNKWLIEDQLNGRKELRWDGDDAPAPLLTWGPYLWTVAGEPRSDGYRWTPAMVVADGVHLSDAGQERMGRELVEFFSHDAQAKTWFMKVGTPSNAVAAVETKFPNPAGSYKVEVQGDVTKPPKAAGENDPAWWLGPNNKLPKVVRLVDPHTTVRAVFKDTTGKPLIELDDILRRHTNLDELLGPGEYMVDFLDTEGNKIKLTLDVDTILHVK